MLSRHAWRDTSASAKSGSAGSAQLHQPGVRFQKKRLYRPVLPLLSLTWQLFASPSLGSVTASADLFRPGFADRTARPKHHPPHGLNRLPAWFAVGLFDVKSAHHGCNRLPIGSAVQHDFGNVQGFGPSDFPSTNPGPSSRDQADFFFMKKNRPNGRRRPPPSPVRSRQSGTRHALAKRRTFPL